MRLSSADFPAGTPLHHFFAWNERARRPDRRYRIARDPDAAPSPIADALLAARGNADTAAHARMFAAFEAAIRRARGPRRILVIRLSAFGDFVQALGPFAAIRRHHSDDHLALLTTRPFAGFARDLGIFDEVLIDERPPPLALREWRRLRRLLRGGRYDRVYDLQTSQRTGLYAWLMRPGLPEWSGIARGCSHPHANIDRDRQHTLDKQAEQLLMAGIYPTPAPEFPPLTCPLPEGTENRNLVILVPGSSPLRPEKRWPAARFGEVAVALRDRGYLPVIVGSAAETPLAAAIREICPAALDVTGKTDLTTLAALAQHARLTIGNDTGVCHLAAAANCPVIVLFSRASDPAMCAPRGRLVQIIAEPDLADVPADTVIAAARTVLGANRGSAAGARLVAVGTK